MKRVNEAREDKKKGGMQGREMGDVERVKKQSAAQVPMLPRSSQNVHTSVSLSHTCTHMCILVHTVIKP